MKKIMFATVILSSLFTLTGCINGSSESSTEEAYAAEVDSQIQYSSHGKQAMFDENKNAYFFLNDEVVEIDGTFSNGYSSPDHSAYVLIDEDKNMYLYLNSDRTNAIKISNDISDTNYQVSDSGCLYWNDDHKLFFYDFSLQKTITTGLTIPKGASSDSESVENIIFSSEKTAAATLNDGMVSVYAAGQEQASESYSIDSDATLLAVSNDGSKVIYATPNGATFTIFIIENNASKELGEMRGDEEADLSPEACFFDNGNSCAAYAVNSYNFIYSIDGNDPVNIELPEDYTITTKLFVDGDGRHIDSEDDSIKDFVYMQTSSWSFDSYFLRLNLTKHTATRIVDTSLNDCYLLNGYVYFHSHELEGPEKLLKKGLKSNEHLPETTVMKNIDSLQIPDSGKYAYVTQNESLYYLDLTQKKAQLNKICDGFKTIDRRSTDRFYLTDRPDLIYYRDQDDTLYEYTVGGTPIKIAENITGMYSRSDILNDENDVVSSTLPVAEMQSGSDDSVYTNTIGVIENSEYIVKIEK